MALRSTIFKLALNVADVDRGYYADHALTLARHPSETDERMLIRVLAFAHLADPGLAFGKGLSDADEPDLVQIEDDGAIAHWIEVGLPDERALAKAHGRAARVSVYAYGGNAANMWWNANRVRLARLSRLRVWRVPEAASRALGAWAARAMNLQATIDGHQIMLSGADDHLLVELALLQDFAAP